MYSGDEVVESCGGAILDAEVIDYKGKLDAGGCIGEQTGDIGIFEITMAGKVFDQVAVGEKGGLG